MTRAAVPSTIPILRLAEERPGEPAAADAERSLTWAETADEVVRTANALLARGLSGDRRLAVMAENSVRTLLVYAAAELAGIGAVLVNFHLGAAEVAHLLADSGARAVWVDAEHADVARRAIATTGADIALLQTGTPSWDREVRAASAKPPPAGAAPGHDLIYTSGTTGVPKGVELPIHLPATVADRIAETARHHAHGLGPHLVVAPMYHTGPHAAVGLLLAGNRIVVLGRFDAESVLQAVQEHAIATTLMVPTHFVRLLALPAEVRARYETGTLRLIAHTGSGCPEPVKRAMIDWFGPVLRESYGATESGIIAYTTSVEWLAHPGSVGRVQPPYEAVVLGDDGSVRGANEEGVLYFRDRTGRGIRYLNDAAKTAAAHREPGVFTLGDVGYLDADGYLFITGRSSDMVLSGGVNIYPAECEQTLLRHPAVQDATLFGIPDPEMGERLVGLVVADEGAVSAQDLIDHCRDRLAHYKVPRQLRLVPQIPRNAMGKVDKRALAVEGAHSFGARAGNS